MTTIFSFVARLITEPKRRHNEQLLSWYNGRRKKLSIHDDITPFRGALLHGQMDLTLFYCGKMRSYKYAGAIEIRQPRRIAFRLLRTHVKRTPCKNAPSSSPPPGLKLHLKTRLRSPTLNLLIILSFDTYYCADSLLDFFFFFINLSQWVCGLIIYSKGKL